MKIKYVIFSLCCAVLFNCEEDSVRSLVQDDGVAPGMLQNVVVENLAGAAKLSYNLPNDTDLLYVEAKFNRQSTAAESSVRSSIFKNNMIVEGFGEVKDYQVTLYAVDESENKSQPVTVTISPEKSPIQYVYESLAGNGDFGGFYVKWENPFQVPISLEISTLNDLGELEVVDIVYSDALEQGYAVRGFDTTERTFHVIVKDRYDNIAPTKSFTVTPLFEETIPKTEYLAGGSVEQPHDSPVAFNWQLNRLYDNNFNRGFHTSSTWVDPLGELPEYEGLNVHPFTLDLGVTAKLSRIVWHQRRNGGNNTRLYAHGNPRYYEIWGGTQLNPDGSLDGWTKIVANGEVIKPSGLPVLTNTQEDNEVGLAGEDVTVDPSAPPIRYIRWINLRNWTGSTYLHVMEIQAYGQIIQ